MITARVLRYGVLNGARWFSLTCIGIEPDAKGWGAKKGAFELDEVLVVSLTAIMVHRLTRAGCVVNLESIELLKCKTFKLVFCNTLRIEEKTWKRR